MDYCPGGDLSEYLALEKRFNDDKTRLYAAEILLGIEELHRRGVIFRDLKPDNVILDKDGHALLTDFGLSKEGIKEEDMTKSFCGSYAYLAPEMLMKKGHGQAVDWYLGQPPYYSSEKEQLFANIKKASLNLPDFLSADSCDILLQLLHRDPKKRLGYNGPDEIKSHQYFKSINWTKMLIRQYLPPDPYLKLRFESFLKLPDHLKTNQEIKNQYIRDLQKNLPLTKSMENFQGWSFISPELK